MTKIIDSGDTCKIVHRTNSSSNVFPLPISRETALTLLRQVAKSGDATEVTGHALHVEKVADGFNFRAPTGAFHIHWSDAIQLLLD